MTKNQQPYKPGTGGTKKYFPHLGGALLLATASMLAYNQKWESGNDRVLVVYADRLAGGLPTVCNGITKHVTTTPIIVGQKWTEEKCIQEETQALIKVQTRLAMCFKILPPQSVFEMGTSHAWNNGTSATCGSGAMRAWNTGNWDLGCRRLAYSDSGRRVWSYVKDGKNADGTWKYKFVRGLGNRRHDEYMNCLPEQWK